MKKSVRTKYLLFFVLNLLVISTCYASKQAIVTLKEKLAKYVSSLSGHTTVLRSNNRLSIQYRTRYFYKKNIHNYTVMSNKQFKVNRPRDDGVYARIYLVTGKYQGSRNFPRANRFCRKLAYDN